MITLYKKELNYYLNNPVGYIIVILFAVFVNFIFVKDIFVGGVVTLRPFFGFLPWLLIIFIPALSMRILSEEKRINTIEILLSLPVSETQIVLSKFLALLTLSVIGLSLTFSLPVSLAFIAKVYLPEIIIGYIGVILMSAFFISLSMFFSSLTKNQVIAFLTSTLTLFLLLVLASDFFSSLFPKIIQDFSTYFSPLYHLDSFVKGIVDLRSVVYFVSFIVVFLFLTIVDLEKRS